MNFGCRKNCLAVAALLTCMSCMSADGKVVAEGVPPLGAGPGVTVEEWEKRRVGLKDVFLREMYGRRTVERPDVLTFADHYPPEEFSRPRRAIDALRRVMMCRYRGPYGEDHFRFTVFLPKNAKGPVPAFIFICDGNPGVHIDPWRFQRSCVWPAERIVDRGYAAIAFWAEEVAADSYNPEYAFRSGVFRCFEKSGEPRADDAWGVLSAWAWGASRILDWIETEPSIDAKRVAVVGHSRGGKAALVAGVTDPRFALTVSNNSGCGGAKLNHADLPKSEHFHQICRSVSYWFCRNLLKWRGREREMPFDQHQFIALLAPRLGYVASGSEDHWAGPEGERLSVELARPAWDVYGVKDGLGYHCREGKHRLTEYDWDKFMDFADRHGWNSPER